MRVFIAKKIFYLMMVLIGISFLSFVLANVASVDPAEAQARRQSRSVNEEMIEDMREELGFNQSIPTQYFDWLGRTVHLDFGNSYISNKPVLGEITSAIPATFTIAFLACIFVLSLSVPLGILSAQYQGKLLDKIIGGISFLSVSVPGYLVGLLCLLLLGLRMKLFPVLPCCSI